MNARRTTLVWVISAMLALTVMSAVSALITATLAAQASRVPAGSDSAALAIVERWFRATFLGPRPEYSHWIEEMTVGDGPPLRTEAFMAGRNKIFARGSVLGQVFLEFGSDGTTGWTVAPNTGVTTVTGRELETMHAGIRSPLGAAPTRTDSRFVAGGKVMLEGEFTDLVLRIDAEGDTTEQYYAVLSGLLSAVRVPPRSGGRGHTITFYRDYKRFGGEQVATTKVTVLRSGKKMTTRMVHMDTDSIPEERFRRP
jgi:hypothetical protein